MMNARLKLITVIALVLTAAMTAGAQSNAAPFDMIGIIQHATVDSPTNPLSGGTITINNHKITVPANAIVQMPATALGWGQVFSMAPSANSAGGTESGLAMGDSSPLPGRYEAHIQGNIVNGQYIAGLIFLAQQALNSGQGFIDAIDYAAGEIHVNGTRIQINDPQGRFSKGLSPDPRFTADEDNPTIRTETAYPVCIPRVDPTQQVSGGNALADDPQCPQANRPKANGAYQMTFTMPAPGNAAGVPNPTLQAPVEVGDYITYAGVLQRDANGEYISAYQLIANVGIYTSPHTDPAYVAIDVMLQGTGGVPNPSFPQEATSKVKVEGFSTDPTRTVNIAAVDTDCNGAVTTRNWIIGQTVDPGPPTGAKKGRFRYIPTGGTFLPPAREIRVSINSAAHPVVANGLVAGQYQAPEFDFIFPENLGVGDPPVALNLGDFVWLVNGIGPWAGGMVGQLKPWPDVTTPTPTCTASTSGGGGGTPPPPPPPSATAPVATATAAPNPVVSGGVVTLDGTGSADTNSPPLALSYKWTQTGGPSVTLSNANSATASFNAPLIAAGGVPATLTLSLQVTNSAGLVSAPASVTVNVSPATDGVAITLAQYRTSKNRLTVNATDTQVSPNINLTCILDVINPSTGQPYSVLMTNLGSGNYTVQFNPASVPRKVTVVSNLGGFASTSAISVIK